MGENIINVSGRLLVVDRKDFSESEIIALMQERFPRVFPPTHTWYIENFVPGLDFYEMKLKVIICPGGYDCDVCGEPIRDDIRYSKDTEDICPDCYKGELGYEKLSARPFICKDIKKAFYSKSLTPLEHINPEDEEKYLEKLKVLFRFMGRDANIQSFSKPWLLDEKEEGIFGVKKIKPMLTNEKKTLVLARNVMKEFRGFLRSKKSEKFNALFLLIEQAKSCEDLENL